MPLFVASAANAAVGVQRWESLTCKSKTPTCRRSPNSGFGPEPGIEKSLTPPAGQCKGSTPGKALHPGRRPPELTGSPTSGSTPTRASSASAGSRPTFLKDIVVDTPEGLSVNPEALPQCEVEELETTGECPAADAGRRQLPHRRGADARTAKTNAPANRRRSQANACRPASRCRSTTWCRSRECRRWSRFPTEGGPDLHRRLAEPGRPARHLHDQRHPSAVGEPARRSSSRAWSSSAPKANEPEPARRRDLPDDAEQLRRRPGLEVDPRHAGSSLRSRSVEHRRQRTRRRPARPAAQTCRSNRKSRSPRKAGKAVDSPEPTTVDVGIPFDPQAPIANSYLKVAKVTLPEGMGINPSAGNGAHVVHATNSSTTTRICRWNARRRRRSARSKSQTPALPAGSITGEVYVGAPLKNGPGVFESGEQFRIFIYALLGPVRRQRAPRGQGLPERDHRSADRGRAGKSAGDVPGTSACTSTAATRAS